MSNRNNIEELKLQNEMLKNKTEKLRLIRNIAAVASIIISVVTFLFFKQDFSSGSIINNNGANTQVESNINNNSNQTSSPSGSNNSSNQSDKDSEDDDDSDDDDDDDIE